MKIHHMIQGTPEWLAVRAGIPTASEFNSLVTPKKREISKSDGYFYQKLAEKWLGHPLEDHATAFAMEQGKILEEHAIPFYEMEFSCEIERVGFVTTDDGRYGCSPDGMIGASGIEIKCPKPETHAAYLIGGVLPSDYLGQVQGSMLVTGAAEWTFMSYCRGFPPFVIRCLRDEPYLKVLSEALDLFTARLDREYKQLVKINGGEPKRTPLRIETQWNTTTTSAEGVPDDAIEQFLNSTASKRIGTL